MTKDASSSKTSDQKETKHDSPMDRKNISNPSGRPASSNKPMDRKDSKNVASSDRKSSSPGSGADKKSSRPWSAESRIRNRKLKSACDLIFRLVWFWTQLKGTPAGQLPVGVPLSPLPTGHLRKQVQKEAVAKPVFPEGLRETLPGSQFSITREARTAT